MSDFSGTPAEVKIWVQIGGVWTPIWEDYVPRQSISIRGPKDKQVSLDSVTQHGYDLNLLNQQKVRVQIEDEYQLTGFIQVRTTSTSGNQKTYNLSIDGGNIILSRGPNAQITERITIPPGQSDHTVIVGGTFVLAEWAASTDYFIGDYAEPITPDGSYYRITPAEPDVWAPNTVYALKDFRQPTARDGKVFKVTVVTTGKSGPTEPNWASLTTLGQTLVDGGLAWRYDATTTSSGMVQPVWPTGIGQTVADGAFVWECLGSKTWAGLGSTYCPEVAMTGVNTLITSMSELVFEKTTFAGALDIIRSQAVGGVNWDWLLDVDSLTGEWVLVTFDWNNPTYVSETTMAFVEGQPVSATVAGWLPNSFNRIIAGQPVNALTVWGPNGAKGEIDGSVAAPKAWTPNLTTNRLVSNAHGLTDGTAVYLSNPTGGAHNLPHPLRAYQANGLPQVYYVAGATANTFYLTYTPGGNQITFKSAGGAGTYMVVDARYDEYAALSVATYGKWTGEQIVLEHPIYADNEACREYARAYVRYYYKPFENIRLDSHQMIDAGILRGPHVVLVTNTAEGLEDEVYPVRNATLGFSAAGIAIWSYELGDVFPVQGQPPNFGLRFGQVSPGDTSPPDQITDLRHNQNYYQAGNDTSYIGLIWTNPRARDYRRAQVTFSVLGTTFRGAIPSIEKPDASALVWAYPGRTYDFQITAYDQAGNAYQPPAPYRVVAAPRGLHHTYNPNFVQRNRISGEPAPEGWFDVLSSGSTIEHRPPYVILTAPTNGGAHIFSDKQRANGGDASYAYTLEVQAASNASSKIVVDVSYYEETIEGLPGALISAQAALASTTVTSALFTRHIPLTVPSTARFLSIKAGIPSGVTTQPLVLMSVRVVEKFIALPATNLAVTGLSGGIAGTYIEANDLVGLVLTWTPGPGAVNQNVFLTVNGEQRYEVAGPYAEKYLELAPGDVVSQWYVVSYTADGTPSEPSANGPTFTAAARTAPAAVTNLTRTANTYRADIDRAAVVHTWALSTSERVINQNLVMTVNGEAQYYPAGSVDHAYVELAPGAVVTDVHVIAYRSDGTPSDPSDEAGDFTAAARPIPDAPGTPDYSAYEINRLSADGRIATVGVLFEKSTSPNVVRHELFSPWVTYPEGQIVEDAILPLEVSDDDPAHSIGEFEIEPGTIIATPSVRVIDTWGIPSAWSPPSTETITAVFAPHDSPSNLTADLPDPRDQNGALYWRKVGPITINSSTANGRYWHLPVNEGAGVQLLLKGWRWTPGHLYEIGWRVFTDGNVIDEGQYRIRLRQWDTWANYLAGATPNATAMIQDYTVVDLTSPEVTLGYVTPTYAYVELEVNAIVLGGAINLDFTHWRDMDGVGEPAELTTPDKVLVPAVNYVHGQVSGIIPAPIVTTAEDSTLTGQIVKPWLANTTNLDTPASPATYDDEFSGGALAGKWSWTNPGTGGELASVAVAGGYARLSIPGSGASDVRLLKQTAPSGAFSIIAGPFSLGRGSVFANEAWGGIFIGEATPGKFVHASIGQDNSQQRLIHMQRWSSPTLFNFNVNQLITGQPRHPIEPLWLRLDYNGSTTFTAYHTLDPNANEWWAYAIDTTSFLTPGSIGIVAHNSSASTSDVLYVRVDAFRRFS